jgi:hypothetical protein
MCRNIVFTWDTSGLSECEHDTWQNLWENNSFVLE